MRRGPPIASIVFTSAFAIAAAGCTSVKTRIEDPADVAAEGLVYWLPKRDIVVTVTVEETGGVRKVSVNAAAGDSYPDYANRFVLDYQPNLFGKSALEVTVNERGLLKSVGSETTSGISSALTGLAQSIAAIKPASLRMAVKQPVCGPGVYRRLVKPEAPAEDIAENLCEFKIQEVTPLLPASVVGKDASNHKGTDNLKRGNAESGVFYRQDIPYIVKVTANSNAATTQFLVFSPNASPRYFLPIRGTFFANNSATITLNDGVPTQYKQSTEGELVALLSLPATVISAYFEAMGNLFQKKEAAVVNQKDYLDALNKLAVESVRNQACKDAINTWPAASIDTIRNACGVGK